MSEIHYHTRQEIPIMFTRGISTTEASRMALQLLTLLVHHYPGILSQDVAEMDISESELQVLISENLGPELRAYLARAQEVL
jgi:hypothetical protein